MALDEAGKRSLEDTLSDWRASFSEYEKLSARSLALTKELEEIEQQMSNAKQVEEEMSVKIQNIADAYVDDKEAISEINKIISESIANVTPMVQVIE